MHHRERIDESGKIPDRVMNVMDERNNANHNDAGLLRPRTGTRDQASLTPRHSKAMSIDREPEASHELSQLVHDDKSDENSSFGHDEEDIEAAASIRERPGCFQRSKKDMRKRRTASRRLEMLSGAVDRMQRMRVPSWCNRYFLRRNKEEDIRVILGLDRVLFGTVSAAEAVRICGIKPPRYLFYMMSGSLCDVIQFFLDFTIHFSLNVKDPSVCWALGFGLSIIFRHTSHRYFVFGDYVGGYWNSLMRMYGGYSIIIGLSTLFNIVMTKWAQLPHYIAWVVTLLWTGVVNYFILKRLWSFGGK